ncbi:MAG: hypothetical protein HOK80_10685, partial [Candidatus Cloacimonetes bacterium]|nr:hypothetical protein [Candidatus Cloacimonadota bacterium]
KKTDFKNVTPTVRDLFWEVAKKSLNQNAVNWGITVASNNLNKQDIKYLKIFVMAWTTSTTVFRVIQRESKNLPELKELLIDLLSIVKGTELTSLIIIIGEDEKLISDYEIQKKILLKGMEYSNDFYEGEGFYIAKNIDLSHFVRIAQDDEIIYKTLVSLFNLLYNRICEHGIHGLQCLKGWENIFLEFIELIKKKEADFTRLLALWGVLDFLGNVEVTIDSKELILREIYMMYENNNSSEVIISRLSDDSWFGPAYNFILDKKIDYVLPSVIDMFRKTPEIDLAEIIGELGTSYHIFLMFEILFDIIDIKKRTTLPHLDNKDIEDEWGYLYAKIVTYLGKIDVVTPKLYLQLNTAASDYNPNVREAAMLAIHDLQSYIINRELSDLIMQGLKDKAENVVLWAKLATEKHDFQDK